MQTQFDIRWKQRLVSFTRAHALLREALSGDLSTLRPLEREGIIHRFEFTFELAWKLLKDFLESSGTELQTATPKGVLKAAFAAHLVADGQLWVDMLMRRNVMSHQYSEAQFEEALKEIQQRFLPALNDLQAQFAQRALEP